MTDRDRSHELFAEVVVSVPATLREIAEEAGVSRASLYNWARGTRNPRPENLARLADTIERRGRRLVTLGRELRGASGSRRNREDR